MARASRRRRLRLPSWKLAVVVAAAAGLGVERSWAAEMTYFYGYRAEFSDNIRRVPVNRESDMLNVLTGGVLYEDTTEWLDLRLAPTIEYLNYRKDTFDEELRVTLDAVAVWTLSPQRLTWTLEDTARQVRLDPTEPDTPTNTALANLFNTGPDLYVRFNPLNTLQLGLRYMNVYIEDTELDSERDQVYARWLYQYSPITVLSLNAERQDVRFDNAQVNPEFERNDVFLRLDVRRDWSTFVLDLGKSSVKREGAEEVDGGLARLSWTRRATTETSYGLTAETGLGDTGTDLAATAASVGGTGSTVSQNLVSEDVFRAKRAEVFYNRAGSQFVTDLRLFGRDLEFQVTPLDDREEYGGNLTLSYLYSAAMSFSIYGQRERIEYQNQDLIDTDTIVGVRGLRWLTRNVSVSLDIQREERDSTDPGREFVDNRVLFSIMYNSGTIPRGQ